MFTIDAFGSNWFKENAAVAAITSAACWELIEIEIEAPICAHTGSWYSSTEADKLKGGEIRMGKINLKDAMKNIAGSKERVAPKTSTVVSILPKIARQP